MGDRALCGVEIVQEINQRTPGVSGNRCSEISSTAMVVTGQQASNKHDSAVVPWFRAGWAGWVLGRVRCDSNPPSGHMNATGRQASTELPLVTRYIPWRTCRVLRRGPRLVASMKCQAHARVVCSTFTSWLLALWRWPSAGGGFKCRFYILKVFPFGGVYISAASFGR